MVETETYRSDIYVYFNVNLNLSKINKSAFFVSEQYIDSIMHHATIKFTHDCLSHE